MSRPRFSSESLRFLRALKRNNRREWFNAHRDDYEVHVRQPMIAVVTQLADDFRDFGPEFVANPKTSMYRIYRDIRFSENKAPYKTHVAASFPTRGLPKHEGAGLYFHVSPDEVWISRVDSGSGTLLQSTLMPPESAIFLRRRAFLKLVGALAASDVGTLEGERLLRVPRGFSKDHEAAGYLKFRQFLAGREFEPAFATRPTFTRGC
jgi:uncharacterized protein (TIGR02453 family)